MKKLNKRIWPIIIWIILWEVLSIVVGKDILLTGPLKTVKCALFILKTPVYWHSIFFTFARIGYGFFLAVIAGILFAILATHYGYIKEFLAPFVFTIKTIPVASFIILVLIWFSSRSLSIVISFLMGFPIIYTNMLEGISQRNIKMQELARVFKIPALRRIRYIDLGELLPYFTAGCKVASGLCWKAGIAAEVIGMPPRSIGEQLQQAKVYLDTPNLFAWTLIIIGISLLFEKVVIFIITRLFEKIGKVSRL